MVISPGQRGLHAHSSLVRVCSVLILLVWPVTAAAASLQVHNKLAGQYNRQQIEQALQAMMNDALAYNTVDDFHFKLT